AIRSLPAGSWMIVSSSGASEPRTYFSIAAVLCDAAHSWQRSDKERRQIIRKAVAESVRFHLVSDVPVGAFLSSGRDSSTVVALAAETARSLQTVTLRFGEYIGTEKDEAPLAAQVAMQYGTTHSTATVSGDEFRRELP